jgi:hypothetical protein
MHSIAAVPMESPDHKGLKGQQVLPDRKDL